MATRFREGTIKRACYDALLDAGARGLTVRRRDSARERSTRRAVVVAIYVERGPSSLAERGHSMETDAFESRAQVKEIARAVRERSVGVKLGGATPQNTIVGQLSKGARERAGRGDARDRGDARGQETRRRRDGKDTENAMTDAETDDEMRDVIDPTFILIKRATYSVIPETLEEEEAKACAKRGVKRERESASDVAALAVEAAANVKPALTTMTYESESDKSSLSELVDVNLAYEPGCMVEVARPHESHGATWANAKVIENDGTTITLGVESEGGHEADADVIRLPATLLSSTIRPRPPTETLAVDQSLRLNEEVDVHYNNRWCEGYISQITDARGKIVVCFPGVGVKKDTALIVFQDSTGQSWIRETWNKTRPKRASIRRGWTLSLNGRWSPRGVPQENGTAGPDSAYKQLAAASVSEAGDSTQRFTGGKNVASEQPSRNVSTAIAGATVASFVGESTKGVVTSDETDCPFKSISEACFHLLLTAGPAGLQVSAMVRAIRERSLVKLAGKTPANTVYSRLSQDARFLNVSRGAYALVSVVEAAAEAQNNAGQHKSHADESPKRPVPRVSENRMRATMNPMSTEHSGINRDGFASATPSIAGDYSISKSCMSELSNASELLLGLRRGRSN